MTKPYPKEVVRRFETWWEQVTKQLTRHQRVWEELKPMLLDAYARGWADSQGWDENTRLIEDGNRRPDEVQSLHAVPGQGDTDR